MTAKKRSSEEGAVGAAIPEWQYPIRYDAENEIHGDVLILGGGIAGCWAAISAAKKGLKVVIVEKASVIRSGAGGAGCDHWHFATTNPACKVTPEEFTQALVENHEGWQCGIHRYIQCRESYDALLELELMGVKVRDSEDVFKGAPFRDEKTKLLFAYDYENKYTTRIWGTGIKPALYNECLQWGVTICDRVFITSLLTEGGKQRSRVVGATGVNDRTGEFYVFQAKATVLCMSRPEKMWELSTELNAYGTHTDPPYAGDGHAMAWKAGAEFTMMEKSEPYAGSFRRPLYGYGNSSDTWRPCSIVDANGKEIPWFDRDGRKLSTVSERTVPSPGQKFFLDGGGAMAHPHHGIYEYMPPHIMPIAEQLECIKKGELTPPFYADLPSMPEHERRVIWGLMVGQEGKTHIPIYRTYSRAGFDPDKDMLQCDPYLGTWGKGAGPAQWRKSGFCSGGLVIDWDLKTSLDGLFAAGQQIFSSEDHSNAATTGRYAGRKAAEYALKAAQPGIDRKQVEAEKARVYAPIKRTTGTEWKELNAGICRVMQDYCGDFKNEALLKVGLTWLRELREGEGATAYARNPHELMHALGCLSMITVGEMIMHASLARKASCETMNFFRRDYPENDPPEWRKWITTRLENETVKIGELPIDYWGDLKKNYEAHCGLVK